ncbi:HPr(Ser) kinase/phosphatase [Clostridium sp. Cult3]|uniref:HPr(Ser) kinase/phosphatase n=1 Tax=Clostridium sp. Cult3 TaxID=2079004 RepID=UPI001F00EE76|nr:HPr(Ser) kinase/phosphatase [Clostridium sp. Cult3]MCF6460695.1 HPr kinase/phosphorylase [Clostridium sp. Cult3]
MDCVTLEKIVEDLDLEIIYRAKDMEKVEITASEINRPGLQLAGYFHRFAYERLQIIGNVEWDYLSSLSKKVRYDRFKNMFTYPMPAIIISRGLEVFPEIISLGKECNISILRTELPTTKFINALINYLDYMLAPETTVHGVLIEVYGMGILIMGSSGVGKSETALELIKRGHRLVADDAVEIKRVEEELRGEAPALIRHFMEIRGIGILDIERLYGVGAVKKSEFIDLVVELEFWDEDKEYDRVGLDEEYIELLGVKIPKVVIPVRPGRNIAMIVEVAARNTRQKKLGYNAAEELNNKVKEQIRNRKNNNK